MSIIKLITLKPELENIIGIFRNYISQTRDEIIHSKANFQENFQKQKKYCEMQIASDKNKIEATINDTLEYDDSCQKYDEIIKENYDIFINYQNNINALITHQNNNYSSLNTIPGKAHFPPDIIRIGKFYSLGTLTSNNLRLDDFPAIVPIRASSADSNIHQPGHIAIFSNDAASREAALAAIQSIAIRAIATFPVLKLKGIFLDPVGMGNNFPFKNLPEKIRGLKTYTRGDDIQEQLRSLNLHIEQVIQNYLGKNYKTIDEFNEAAYVKQAYHYLFAADFPTFFDNKSWEDLKSLLVNGARAGVYAVIHIDTTLEKPRSFDYKVFHDYCTVLQPSKNQSNGVPLFTATLPNGLANNIELDIPPSNEHFNQIAQIITEAEKNIETETVPFKELYPTGEEWSFDSRKEIRAPIGLEGATDHLEFWMGKNDDGQVISNGLLAGKPGAGKSFTLHAIITSLAMRYSPEELEMYLLDFKEGVEFQTYVDPEKSENKNADEELDESNALPHAQVISVESDREFGLSVLEYIKEQITERGRTFKEFGVENITEYRNKNEKMPRILVLIDEYQSMFEENDEITTKLNNIFDTIVRKGRAYGIHLLLASQSPDVSNINRSIYNQVGLRMAQQMDKNTAASVLDAANIDAVDLLDRPGKIIFNRDFGKKSYNQVGQVADISREERIKALKSIREIAKRTDYQRTRPLTLFNGARLTKLNHNLKLEELSKKITDNQRWLTSKELKDLVEERDWFAQEHPGVAWLGEAMRIGNHTKAIFRRRASSNMLMIGTSEETIFGILSGMLISLVHCYQPKQAQFNIIDLSISDEDNSWADMSQNFRDSFNSLFDITLGKRFPDEDKQQKSIEAEEVLTKTYDEFIKRKETRDKNPNEKQSNPSLFFVFALGDLNRGQQMKLKSTGTGFSSSLSSNAEKLLEIVSQGSELGIHTILWIDNKKTFDKLTANQASSWLDHFALRVALRMSGADSQTFLVDTYAKNLGDLRAYLYNELTSSLEKFKPYEVLTDFSKYSKE